MKSQRLFEAFGYIDDWYLDVADVPETASQDKNQKTNHISIKRTIRILLAAVICISILVLTAVATEWFPGLFNKLKEEYPYDEALFEAAAQANTDAAPEVLEIPSLDLSKLVIMERYFDGETILVGYDLDTVLPAPVVGIELTEKLLNEVKKGVRASRIGWDGPQPWHEEPPTENAIRYDFTEDAFTMDRMLKSTLTDSEYQKVWNLMLENGFVCVAVRDAWIGDHVLVNGIDTIEHYLADGVSYSNRTDYITEHGNCIRLEPLPEEIKLLDHVTVTVDVRSSLEYWYMDMNGEGRIYYDGNTTESEPLSFVLERSEKNE